MVPKDYENMEIELYNELSQYRNISQIVKKELFGIVGTTVNGDAILFPDSFQRGFMYELTPLNRRPKTEFEILGVASATSDGHLNYLPSYNNGKELGRELKFHLLAEMTRKLSQENQGLKGMINDLKSKLDDFINKKSK